MHGISSSSTIGFVATLLSSFLPRAPFTTATTATITLDPAYASLRPCAQDCYYLGAFAGPDRLADNLGCAHSPIENECICRGDLQDDGQAFLSSCVLETCSRAVIDVNSAVSLYNGYCTSNGFTRDAIQTTQPPSSGQASSGSTAVVSGPTPTADTGSGSGDSSNAVGSQTDTSSGRSGSGLGTGEMIGIIVGVLGFIATSIGVCVSCRQVRQKREERARNIAGGGLPQQQQYHQQPSYQMWAQQQHYHQGGKAWT